MHNIVVTRKRLCSGIWLNGEIFAYVYCLFLLTEHWLANVFLIWKGYIYPLGLTLVSGVVQIPQSRAQLRRGWPSSPRSASGTGERRGLLAGFPKASWIGKESAVRHTRPRTHPPASMNHWLSQGIGCSQKFRNLALCILMVWLS